MKGAQHAQAAYISDLLSQEGNIMPYSKINIAEQSFNPFEMIAKQWTLI